MGSASSPGTILVIDDDELSRRFARALLKETGYTIVLADHVNTGLARARERLPALILLDLVMDHATGFEFLERRRLVAGLEEVPVIVASSLNDRTSVAKAIALGARDYILKPFDKDTLLSKLNKLVGSPEFHSRTFKEEERPRAQIRLNGTLTHVSEHGVVLEAPTKIGDDAFIKIRSKLLDTLEYGGIAFCGVQSVARAEEGSGIYTTELTAVGLKEETAKQIRKTIRYWK